MIGNQDETGGSNILMSYLTNDGKSWKEIKTEINKNDTEIKEPNLEEIIERMKDNISSWEYYKTHCEIWRRHTKSKFVGIY